MLAADFACPRSDEAAWREARRSGIGSSDAPVLVLGRAYGRTPLDLFMEKVGTRTTEREETEAMQSGRDLEPYVLKRFCREADQGTVGTPLGLYRNRERPFLVCTPDAWVSKQGLPIEPRTVELKAFGVLDGWEEGVPDYPRIQAQHQMAVLGLPFCYVAALGGGYGGMRFLWARVERDEEFITGTLLPACEAFWRCVEAKEPPAPGPEDGKALAELAGPVVDGKVVQLGAEFIDLAAALLEEEHLASMFSDSAEGMKNRIKAAMGDATTAVLPNGVKFSWKPNAKGARSFRRLS